MTRPRSTAPLTPSSKRAIGATCEDGDRCMTALDRNRFSSSFLRGGGDDRLRPPGSLSYVAGATDESLKFMTVSELLDRACTRYGAADAALFAAGYRRYSWYDLRRHADDVAAGLLALG